MRGPCKVKGLCRESLAVKNIVVERSIAAPLTDVFATVSDVRNFRNAVPHIIKVEFLTDQQHGKGTRFREARRLKGRETTCDLEVVEYIENERVRIVSDEGGAVWDTVIMVDQVGEKVWLRMEMEARPHKLFARILTPLIRGMIARAVEEDMDSVKAYCEGEKINAAEGEAL